jgi:hypothetical protein
MDYQLYTSPTEKSASDGHATSILNDESRLSQLARQTKFQQRSTGKITPVVFVRTIMRATVQRVASFRHLAVFGGVECEDTLAKQSMWGRVGKSAVEFLGAVLREELRAEPAMLGWKKTVQRVLLADSTILALHPSLHGAFPGSSNHLCTKQASARIQVAMDLTTGQFLQFGVSGFTRNDQAAAFDAIEILKPGDLLMRDLGYYAMNSLEAIESKDAYFLSRLRYKTRLFDESGEEIDLRKILRCAARKKRSEVILDIQLGVKKRLPMRLVAVRVPAKVAAERRRKARADRDSRVNHDAEYYELLGWSILITNLARHLIEETNLVELYALRWRIENIFKAWKGGLEPKILSKHRSNRWHIHCLLLGQILVLSQLGLNGQFAIAGHCDDAGPGSSQRPLPSLFKSLDILLLCGAFDFPQPSAELLEKQLSYHGLYERRRRVPLPQDALNTLDF